MADIYKLERRLIQFNSDYIRNYVQKGKKKEDITTTSIGGIYGRANKIDTSGPVPNPLVPQLSSALSKIGEINTKSPICSNIIGCCCEIRVGNYLISNHSAKKDNISFTKARRVRTNQYMKRCKNCISVFGIEK